MRKQARAGSLSGIVNGIDYTAYNPKTDSAIYENYDVRNYKKGKAANKAALQQELGLEEGDTVRVAGMEFEYYD